MRYDRLSVLVVGTVVMMMLITAAVLLVLYPPNPGSATPYQVEVPGALQTGEPGEGH